MRSATAPAVRVSPGHSVTSKTRRLANTTTPSRATTWTPWGINWTAKCLATIEGSGSSRSASPRPTAAGARLGTSTAHSPSSASSQTRPTGQSTVASHTVRRSGDHGLETREPRRGAIRQARRPVEGVFAHDSRKPRSELTSPRRTRARTTAFRAVYGRVANRPAHVLLGENLRRIAAQRAVTVLELADLAGVPRAELVAVLDGTYDADLEWMRKLAEGLDVEVAELLVDST